MLNLQLSARNLQEIRRFMSQKRFTLLLSKLHKALFGKDKIKLNQWELEFLTKLWVSYLNVGKFDKAAL